MTEASMIEISGDSGEYEFLNEAVELSKDVPGMCIEIGLRRGFGTKTIIDAVRQYCPDKTVVAVDPFGNILYQPREHVEPCRLDYTNQMKNETLAALYTYIVDSPVNFQFFNWTDTEFFWRMKNGIPIYNLEEKLWNAYSMAHLDGPHTGVDLKREVEWFNLRMMRGAVIVIDDVTPDFINIEPIKDLFVQRGWKLIKIGDKKGIWQKC